MAPRPPTGNTQSTKPHHPRPASRKRENGSPEQRKRHTTEKRKEGKRKKRRKRTGRENRTLECRQKCEGQARRTPPVHPTPAHSHAFPPPSLPPLPLPSRATTPPLPPSTPLSYLFAGCVCWCCASFLVCHAEGVRPQAIASINQF